MRRRRTRRRRTRCIRRRRTRRRTKIICLEEKTLSSTRDLVIQSAVRQYIGVIGRVVD